MDEDTEFWEGGGQLVSVLSFTIGIPTPGTASRLWLLRTPKLTYIPSLLSRVDHTISIPVT